MIFIAAPDYCQLIGPLKNKRPTKPLSSANSQEAKRIPTPVQNWAEANPYLYAKYNPPAAMQLATKNMNASENFLYGLIHKLIA